MKQFIGILLLGLASQAFANYCPGSFALNDDVQFGFYPKTIDQDVSPYLVTKITTQEADVISSSRYMGWDYFKERLEGLLKKKTVAKGQTKKVLQCEIRGVVSKQGFFTSHNLPFCDLAYVYTCNQAYVFAGDVKYIADNMEVDFESDSVMFPVSKVEINFVESPF